MGQLRAIPEGLRSAKNVTGGGTAIAAAKLVKLDATTSEGVVVVAAAGDPHFGVTTEAIADGKWGTVQTMGRAVCTASAAITQGAKVTGAAAGKVAAWAPADEANASIVGIAVTGASADNDLIEIELSGPATLGQGV